MGQTVLLRDGGRWGEGETALLIAYLDNDVSKKRRRQICEIQNHGSFYRSAINPIGF